MPKTKIEKQPTIYTLTSVSMENEDIDTIVLTEILNELRKLKYIEVLGEHSETVASEIVKISILGITTTRVNTASVVVTNFCECAKQLMHFKFHCLYTHGLAAEGLGTRIIRDLTENVFKPELKKIKQQLSKSAAE